MRAVLQRVHNAVVHVDGRKISNIDHGLLVYVGVEKDDSAMDVEYIAEKIVHMRIFNDENEKMNISILEAGGEVLVISQFTLLADARKGRRPSYGHAAEPELAEKLYLNCAESIRTFGIPVSTGEFGARMMISYTNDGPVTILIDSRKVF